MKKARKHAGLIAIALVAAMAAPPSALGEKRPRGATDLERLAAELDAIFGPGVVEIRRRDPRDTPAPAPRREAQYGVEQEAIVAAMNRERARHGLGPLRFESRLARAAGERASDMFELGYFDHVAPDGRSPFLTVKNQGYRYRAVGENLATGYATADAVVAGWMRSPGHRANILGRSYEDVGIAVHAGSPVRGYGGPTVVALYASER